MQAQHIVCLINIDSFLYIGRLTYVYFFPKKSAKQTKMFQSEDIIESIESLH